MVESDENVCLVLGFSKGYSFGVAVTILSFIQTNSWFQGDIVVYYEKYDEASFSAIRSIYAKTKFIKLKFPINKVWFSYSYHRFTKMVFHRFEIFELLSQYDWIVGTDFDVIFLSDIQELLNKEVTFAALSNDKHLVRDHFFHSASNIPFAGEPGFSLGFFVLSKKITKKIDKEYLLRILKKYAFSLRLPEQGVFNIAFQEFKIHVHPLGVKYSSDKISPTSVIFHSPGLTKIWQTDNALWNQYYRVFLELGGKPYGDWLQKRFNRRIKFARNLQRIHEIITK